MTTYRFCYEELRWTVKAANAINAARKIRQQLPTDLTPVDCDQFMSDGTSKPVYRWKHLVGEKPTASDPA